MIRFQILTTFLCILGQCHLSLWGQNNVPPPFPSPATTPAPIAPFVPISAVPPVTAVPMPSAPQTPGLFAPGTQEPLELSGVPGLDVEEFKPFVLRKADANSLLDLIQQNTGWNILRTNKDLPAMEISFNSQGHLTKGETIRIVESLLAMHGVGISKISENLYKAIRAEKINMHVPIWLEGPASVIKPSQKIYMTTFHLKYAPAKDIVTHLTPFKTEVGQLVLLENANSILVTDALINLQRMEKLLEKLDRPVSQEDLGMHFIFHPTKYAEARDLESKMKNLIEGSLKPFLGGTTMLDADERTGKLIIVTRLENKAILEKFLNELDSPPEPRKTTSRHIRLQHAEAKEIEPILNEIIKNQEAVRKEAERKQGGKSTPSPATTAKATPGKPATAANAGASKIGGADGASEGAHEFSDYLTVSSDERSNAILVYGTEEDCEEMTKLIESLDQALPQARIDTIFVMVDLSEQNQRGIDALLGNVEWSKFARSPRGEGLFGDPITQDRQVTTAGPDGFFGTPDDTTSTVVSNVARNTLQGVVGIPGLNTNVPFQMEDWKLTGIRWDQIFALGASRNDVRIFSTPSLSFAHNSPDVYILIEDERNIIIPQYAGNTSTDGGGGLGGSPSVIKAVTSLQIKKPKIGMAKTPGGKGSIFMEIELKAEKFDETGTNTYQGQELPAKKVRKAKSHVTVRDGEIIVLGGLKEVQIDSTESKYNLLSDIPYLGKKFFSPKTVKYTPTELLIFIKPTIMNRGLDQTKEQEAKIDKRLKGDYKPTFTAPSGRTLGVPDIDGKLRKEYSDKDKPSELPKL